MTPLHLRDRWRKARLRFWLRLMASCEQRGLTDCEGYFWIVRRAMGCNAWKGVSIVQPR
jgi:hypothetical protein